MTTRLEVQGLHVEVEEGDGPPVVLVHAAIADHTMWDREVAWLAARGHRVITYDVRGFGRSPEPSEDYYDHDDLVAVLDHCDVRTAILVGASNGGRIVLDTALQARDRVAGLFLAGAYVPRVPGDRFFRAGADAENAALEAGDFEGAVEANLSTWVTGHGRGADAVDAQVRDRVRAWLTDLLPRQAAQQYGSELVEPLVRDRLNELLVPTMAVVGEHDAPQLVATAGLIAGSVPHARLAFVDNAAHLSNLEQPDVFAALLQEFLDDVQRRGEVVPDDDAVRQMWASAALRLGRQADSEVPPAWAFGDGSAMADELATLVVQGTKRATAGALIEYEAEGEPLPQPGDLNIIIDGSGRPRCVIRTTEVRVGPLGSVDADFARDEGEMDRTLATWLAGHLRYWHRTLPARFGITVDLDLPVAFERFEVAWRPD